jgi:DNA helicase-2/ATP-dependent DNA helicase PcrA
MHLSEILEELNDKQRQSVILDNNKNALILAGAGSGKTRVLTHRIAYLVTQQNIHIDSILAVTFTNKAAIEMRERLSLLLRRPIRNMWVGTFHGLSHKILRTHYIEANLTKQFQILDSQDQFRIIKRIMKENQIDESKFPVRKIQWYINQQKDEGIKADDIDSGYNYFIKQSVRVFKIYDEHCQKNDLIDFAELLLRSYEVLKNNKDLLSHYQNRFKHILIDEFQDTNTIQYKWIKQLYSENNNLFCVGDDDQSIYGWRGAKIENIQKLESEFIPIQTIRMEQNYRSTGNILAASNALITNNNNRLGKSLWTDSGDGEKIDVFEASTETDESDYVVHSIQKLINEGVNACDCAILYRSNAQSRSFEERLIKQNIPYIIYGGLRFFERAEIKDAMCYLRLIENHSDDVAFERIVNFPSRGIGNATIEKIREYAVQNSTNLFNSSISVIEMLPTRAANSVSNFIKLIKQVAENSNGLGLSDKVSLIIKESGLLDYYSNDKTDKAGSKRDNLEELITAAKQYSHEDESDMTEVLGFISLATLDSSGDMSVPINQNAQLMTIHSAKGLEFPYVFLVGMEEDLFPSRQSKDEPRLIDEERRLCYVGMTRAMKKLTMSFAIRRFLHGQSLYSYHSRFLDEIPVEYLKSIKQNKTSKSFNYTIDDTSNSAINSKSSNQYYVGVNVRHSKFGFGTVINFEGEGESARVQINFKNVGTKWLICAYANLEFI